MKSFPRYFVLLPCSYQEILYLTKKILELFKSWIVQSVWINNSWLHSCQNVLYWILLIKLMESLWVNAPMSSHQLQYCLCYHWHFYIVHLYVLCIYNSISCKLTCIPCIHKILIYCLPIMRKKIIEYCVSVFSTQKGQTSFFSHFENKRLWKSMLLLRFLYVPCSNLLIPILFLLLCQITTFIK